MYHTVKYLIDYLRAMDHDIHVVEARGPEGSDYTKLDEDVSRILAASVPAFDPDHPDQFTLTDATGIPARMVFVEEKVPTYGDTIRVDAYKCGMTFEGLIRLVPNMTNPDLDPWVLTEKPVGGGSVRAALDFYHVRRAHLNDKEEGQQ